METPDVWKKLTPEEKTDIAEFIFLNLTEPCTFRCLIYDRLGLPTSAYTRLYTTPAFNFSDDFMGWQVDTKLLKD